MSAEHDYRPFWDLLDLFNEPRSLRPQVLNHTSVVNDLMPHVDRRPVLPERGLHNPYGSFNPRAEAPRLGQYDSQTSFVSTIRHH